MFRLLPEMVYFFNIITKLHFSLDNRLQFLVLFQKFFYSVSKFHQLVSKFHYPFMFDKNHIFIHIHIARIY